MVYLDYHATTPVATEVLQAMLPYFRELFANPGSVTHRMGREVAMVVDQHVAMIAHALGASDEEIVITSGATESNNLALFGYCLHPRQQRRKIVSVVTEHRAILDPLQRLERSGFEVVMLPVEDQTGTCPGRIILEQALERIDSSTALVTMMLANNEIGVVQPLTAIAERCHEVGAVLHTDATQAVGRIPIDVDLLDVDLLSFSAHKIYGPKGVGGLFVRRRNRRIRLQPQIVGGGQQQNLRSGTLNVPGIVGLARAMQLVTEEMDTEVARQRQLRDHLWHLLSSQLDFVQLNGPPLEHHAPGIDRRLANNLNCCFYPVEGQSLLLEIPDLAVSSGSACTSAHPEPSHVLQAIGLSEDRARSSLRFGLGRDTTMADIETAAQWLVDAALRLRQLTS
ncbi:MAG: cysteine desulfurase [Pirellulaceae bacterium]|nr:MAG: cysteine desulfurase [Pirellulaceae bacterium]